MDYKHIVMHIRKKDLNIYVKEGMGYFPLASTTVLRSSWHGDEEDAEADTAASPVVESEELLAGQALHLLGRQKLIYDPSRRLLVVEVLVAPPIGYPGPRNPIPSPCHRPDHIQSRHPLPPTPVRAAAEGRGGPGYTEALAFHTTARTNRA
jgi:hypothetical protein